METFHSFGLPQALLQSLERFSFTKPTPIQAQAIPLALEGKDILGSAQTGTGKTFAFGIPLITHLLNKAQNAALVITPTRELATQVMQAMKDLIGKKSSIKSALLIGGESMGKQLNHLKENPQLIVGTPGRINDHLKRKSLSLKNTNFLVLDETDRMLDMGFSIQIEQILKFMPQKRQTLLFSATFPKSIVKLAASYLQEPERLALEGTSKPVQKIKQEILHLSEREKYSELLSQLQQREGSVIVFVKTKYNAERMAEQLRTEDHSVNAIHGDLRHNKRESVLKGFRKQKYRILVATDIAARGLDIPHIEHVINYDLPQCPEDYIHRIGRTARAGAEGEALCFVSPSERGKWHAINRLLNPEAAKSEFKEVKQEKPGRAKKKFSSKPASKKSFGFKKNARSEKPFGAARPKREKQGSEKPAVRSKKPFRKRSAA